MNELIVRFPHLMRQLFHKMDNKGLAKIREVARTWQKFIDEGSYSWLRIVNIPTILENVHTYLDLATEYGQIDTVEMILTSEGDENLFQDPSPFLIACQKGHVKIAEMMLMKLYKVRIDCRKSKDVVLDQSEPPKFGSFRKTKYGEQGFLTACCNGRINIVEMLIDKSVPLELDLTATFSGLTGFYLACRGGHTNVVELLLDKSESVNFDLTARDRRGYTGFETTTNVDIINLINSKMPCLVIENQGNHEIFNPFLLPCYVINTD